MISICYRYIKYIIKKKKKKITKKRKKKEEIKIKNIEAKKKNNIYVCIYVETYNQIEIFYKVGI